MTTITTETHPTPGENTHSKQAVSLRYDGMEVETLRIEAHEYEYIYGLPGGDNTFDADEIWASWSVNPERLVINYRKEGRTFRRKDIPASAVWQVEVSYP